MRGILILSIFVLGQFIIGLAYKIIHDKKRYEDDIFSSLPTIDDEGKAKKEKENLEKYT